MLLACVMLLCFAFFGVFQKRQLQPHPNFVRHEKFQMVQRERGLYMTSLCQFISFFRSFSEITFACQYSLQHHMSWVQFLQTVGISQVKVSSGAQVPELFDWSIHSTPAFTGIMLLIF